VAGAIVLGLTNTPIGPLNTFYGDFLSVGAFVWTAIHFSSLREMVSDTNDARENFA
jgi:hypothetical protein